MMDVSRLPDHIVIEIARHLEPCDLLSCSLVSSTWRDAFNSDPIWQRACRSVIGSSKGEEYDDLSSLPYSAPDLYPLCKWRRVFMRWKQLQYNWEKGIFACLNIEQLIPNESTVQNNDHYVVILNKRTCRISVWNIKHIPYHQQSMACCLTGVRPDYFKLCHEFLVAVQKRLLQVFQVTDKGFVLYFRTVIAETEMYFGNIPNEYNVDAWYNATVPNGWSTVVQCDHNGDKLVELFYTRNRYESSYHIWDLDSKTKIAVVPLPIRQSVHLRTEMGITTNVHMYIAKDFVFLNTSKTNDSREQTFVFDLERSKFIEYLIYCKPDFYRTNNSCIYVLDTSRRKITIWALTTLTQRTVEFPFKVGRFNVGSKHLVACSRLCRKIAICNLATLSQKVMEFEFEVSRVEVVHSYLVVYSHTCNNLNRISVYCLNEVKPIFTMHTSNTAVINAVSLSRFLVVGEYSSSSYSRILVYDFVHGGLLYTIPFHTFTHILTNSSKLLTVGTGAKLSLVSFL